MSLIIGRIVSSICNDCGSILDHWCGTVLTVLLLGSWSPLVPVVFKGQGDKAQAYANKDDQEHTSDVVDTDAIALVFDFGTFLLVKFPPLGL